MQTFGLSVSPTEDMSNFLFQDFNIIMSFINKNSL